MMLTKEAEVKVNNFTAKYYESLGYKIPMRKTMQSTYEKTGKEFAYDTSKTIMIKVEHLKENSRAIVEVLCDACKQNKMLVKYSDYNKVMRKTGTYVCRPCSYKKTQKTNLEKYGSISYLGTEECVEKTKEVMRKRYGVESYAQTQEYSEKRHNTCVERYGKSYNQIFRERAMSTLFEKTGYKHALQNPEVVEAIKHTNMERYGAVCTLQNPKVKEKAIKTFYKNSSKISSTQQRYICNLYGGILNYPTKYHNVDIYLTGDNMVIEYDGSGHRLNVIRGSMTDEEFDRKEIIRNIAIKNEGYKQMRIISSRDYLPSDAVLLQMLDDAMQYFAGYPNHSWIDYNIDNSTMRNAENKDGVPYDFGKLRKITKSDLPNDDTENKQRESLQNDDSGEIRCSA